MGGHDRLRAITFYEVWQLHEAAQSIKDNLPQAIGSAYSQKLLRDSVITPPSLPM